MVRATKHCLLVVDDEPDMVQSVKDLFRFDYRIIGATRAKEAMKIIEDEKVHIVMTDQRMPEMTGVDFLKHLRQTHPDAVRLLFTAYADISAVTDAINQGNVYRYISKPWNPGELKMILHQAAEHYDLQEERKILIQEVQEKNRQLLTANEDLRRANELKRAFIKVASHELRTPLTIVMGLAELGTKQEAVSAPLSNWLEQIHRSSIRLNDRVAQIIKMLQTERFERPLQRQEVNLVELIRGAANEVANFIERRAQTLSIDSPDTLGTLSIEANKIHDSLVQLLVNAIKFTPDGGTIHLSARRLADGAVQIAVTDTGVGIAEDSLPHLFNPFFTRIDVSRHCSGDYEFDRRGLGLGLSMVKAFVDMHGGTVKAESKIGVGSTFTVTLPRHDKQAPIVETSEK